MNYKVLSTLALSLSLTGIANDFPRETSPEVVEKSYQASHRLEHAYEIGVSTLSVTVDCQTSKEDAEKAVASKVAALRAEADRAISDLKLGEKNETLGYEFDEKIQSYASNPIANQVNPEKGKFFWTNRCTHEQFEIPTRAKNVHSASVSVSVRFPNNGKVLNQLTSLVNKLESMSEAPADGAKVVCNSRNGNNYDLDVTKSTSKAAWAKIEEVAKERATRKANADFAASHYNNIWAGPESFTPESAYSSVALPTVVKENGKWYAKYSETKNYTVYYKQSSDTSTEAGLLSDKKTYAVTAEAKSEEGLFGKLVIEVVQGCKESKIAAEKSVSPVANEILTKLRQINGGKNTETDRLDVKDPSAAKYNPLQPYQQIRDKSYVQYYYNPCTLKNYELTQPPEVKAFQGKQVLIITSSDLNALSDLRDSYEQKYGSELEDPNQIKVNVHWSASAALATLESMGSKLEEDAVEKFLAPKSAFTCEKGNFSYACLSSATHRMPHYGESAGFAAPASPSGKRQYADASALSDVDASERGLKQFVGTYRYQYTVRKVLVNHRR